MKTYLFLGPSGSGKDTQIDKLIEDYKFQRIATGEMFRTMAEAKDEDGLLAKKAWSEGKWVDSELTYKMLNKWMDKYNKSKDWIFVSVVRSPDQIEMFDKLLRKRNRPLDAVVHFSLSEKSAIERMSLRTICEKCGTSYHSKFKKEKVHGICDVDGGKLIQREDDKPEKIKCRLTEYNKTIKPILKEYKERGILHDIDATPSIEQIHKIVLKELRLNA